MTKIFQYFLEILHRGKRIDTSEWVQGQYCYYSKKHQIKDEQDFFKIVDPDSIGRYVGLTDINGTKIFEDDIITDGKMNYVVKYGFDSRGLCYGVFGFIEKSTTIDELPANKFAMCTIIGNIYDNPELINM